MWTKLNDVNIKSQKYKYSCFPCSLHMALVNLKYNIKMDDSVEDYFGIYYTTHYNIDLKKEGPSDVLQINKAMCNYCNTNCLSLNYQFLYAKLENSQQIKSINDIEKCVIIAATFDTSGHATLFIKNKEKFTYIWTSTDIKETEKSPQPIGKVVISYDCMKRKICFEDGTTGFLDVDMIWIIV